MAYCTEDTPYNKSTATSLSDLSVIDDELNEMDKSGEIYNRHDGLGCSSWQCVQVFVSISLSVVAVSTQVSSTYYHIVVQFYDTQECDCYFQLCVC